MNLTTIMDVWRNRRLIFSLAAKDFKSRYSGSYFGVFWAFVQPLVTILVFWFVFQIGLKVTPVDKHVPFALWFITGLIPWFFFSDAITNATNSFFEYSYLVKKVVFKVSILPVVKIVSSLFVHAVFVVFLLVVYMGYGYKLSASLIQVLYFSVCMLVLTLGLSFLTASLAVFFKDMLQVVGIMLQFGMWLTPIMWSDTIIPLRYRLIFEANPMYYVINGYRSSLIERRWLFVGDLGETIYFWVVSLLICGLGFWIFKRLKPHFADVL